MSDEIKEIINYLTKFINDKEEITKYGCEISVKQVKLLLDYITNLQEKYNKALTDLVHESHKRIELENKITNLQEELEYSNYCNEQLRKKITNLEYKISLLQGKDNETR